jgi:ParB/RepB/Spo0J family partition protein
MNKQTNGSERKTSAAVVAGAVKNIVHAIAPAAVLTGAMDLPLALVRVREGFNPRNLAKAETEQKINDLTESFTKGRRIPPIEVSMSDDGMYEVVDGECRYTAAIRAQAATIPAILFSGTEAEKLAYTFNSNEGEKLTPVEQMKVITRLRDEHGMGRDAIKGVLGTSIGWIDRLIAISKLPKEQLTYLEKGLVSMDVLLQVSRDFKDTPDRGRRALDELVKDAQGQGERATKKHADKSRYKDKDAADGPAPKSTLVWNAAVDFASAIHSKDLVMPVKSISEVKADKIYTLKVPGTALKAVLQLLDLLTEKDAIEKARKEKIARGEWPFRALGEKAALGQSKG